MSITIDGTGTISGLTATGISAVQDLPATGTITNLTTTTISDGTNSTSSTNVIQGSAKAWVNFNGTGTVAIRASYNVSSITDNGAGNYTVNFTNAFADANYAMSGFGRVSEGPLVALASGSTPAAGSVNIVTINPNVATLDTTFVSVAIFR